MPLVGPFVVAYHQTDRVHMVTFSTEGSARATYDTVSNDWAKVLMDNRHLQVTFRLYHPPPPHISTTFYQVLASSGSHNNVEQCENAVRDFSALQTVAPLRTAHFLVAFHETDRVRIIGFSEEPAARSMFRVVSNERAKVVMNRWHSTVRCPIAKSHYQKLNNFPAPGNQRACDLR